MASKLKIAVVTPDREVARGEADMVVAPSVMGEVGILADHRPLLADLAIGPAELRAEGGVERYAVAGGFLEVDRNRVTIMAEAAERADEIDTDRAKEALHDAEAKLKKLEPTSAEYKEQRERVRRAQVRLEVAAN